MVDSSRRRNAPLLRPHSPSRTFYSASRTRVNPYTSLITFSSCPSRNSVMKKPSHNQNQKRTCMCSPTNHPGSFRCSLHKNLTNQTASYSGNRLNARRSAMTNSLVQVDEGDLMKRALSALIRPSSHHQKRRGSFESRPSRLSIMSKADE